MYDPEVQAEMVMGDDVEVVGAAPRGRLLRLPPRPAWRQGQVAPGVWGPRQGLEGIVRV